MGTNYISDTEHNFGIYLQYALHQYSERSRCVRYSQRRWERPQTIRGSFLELVWSRQAERLCTLVIDPDDVLLRKGNRCGYLATYTACKEILDRDLRRVLTIAVKEARKIKCVVVDPEVRVVSPPKYLIELRFVVCPLVEPVIGHPWTNIGYTPSMMRTWRVDWTPRTHADFPVQPGI